MYACMRIITHMYRTWTSTKKDNNHARLVFDAIDCHRVCTHLTPCQCLQTVHRNVWLWATFRTCRRHPCTQRTFIPIPIWPSIHVRIEEGLVHIGWLPESVWSRSTTVDFSRFIKLGNFGPLGLWPKPWGGESIVAVFGETPEQSLILSLFWISSTAILY